MKLEDLQELLRLKRTGQITEETLVALLNAATQKKTKTPEEMEEEKRNRMAEENRKHSQELREKIAERDKIKARQNFIEDRAIEDIDFLSKQLNNNGERVYSDKYLDSLSYYELADLADSIREAKANLEQDKENAKQGFNFVRPDEPSNEAPINLPESSETIVGETQNSIEEPTIETEENTIGENTNEEQIISTPQQALDNQIRVDTTPENAKKPKLISRADEILKNIVNKKNKKAIGVLVASAIVLVGGIALAPSAIVGALGATGTYYGYKEIKKGMGK